MTALFASEGGMPSVPVSHLKGTGTLCLYILKTLCPLCLYIYIYKRGGVLCVCINERRCVICVFKTY